MAKRPLSLPVLHIMLALAGGARHGYAIKQEVEARTDGEIQLGPGTLYEAIQRLEDGGLVAESAGSDPENGREAQRRYYQLTDRGWKTLTAEIRQIRRVVDHAHSHARLRKGLA